LDFRADQRIEDSQDVPPVFEHAEENVAQLGFAFGLAMPFGKDGWRNFYVLAKLVRGMPPKEQPVEKRRFPLRILQVHSDFRRQIS